MHIKRSTLGVDTDLSPRKLQRATSFATPALEAGQHVTLTLKCRQCSAFIKISAVAPVHLNQTLVTKVTEIVRLFVAPLKVPGHAEDVMKKIKALKS